MTSNKPEVVASATNVATEVIHDLEPYDLVLTREHSDTSFQLGPKNSFLRSVSFLADPNVSRLFKEALDSKAITFDGVAVLRAVLNGETGIDVSNVVPMSPDHFKRVRLEHQIKVSNVKSPLKPLPTCTVYYCLRSNYLDDKTGTRVHRVVRVPLFIYYSTELHSYETLLEGSVPLYPAVNELITRSLIAPELRVDNLFNGLTLSTFIRAIGYVKHLGLAPKYRLQFERLVSLLTPAYNQFLGQVLKHSSKFSHLAEIEETKSTELAEYLHIFNHLGGMHQTFEFWGVNSNMINREALGQTLHVGLITQIIQNSSLERVLHEVERQATAVMPYHDWAALVTQYKRAQRLLNESDLDFKAFLEQQFNTQMSELNQCVRRSYPDVQNDLGTYEKLSEYDKCKNIPNLECKSILQSLFGSVGPDGKQNPYEPYKSSIGDLMGNKGAKRISVEDYKRRLARNGGER